MILWKNRGTVNEDYTKSDVDKSSSFADLARQEDMSCKKPKCHICPIKMCCDTGRNIWENIENKDAEVYRKICIMIREGRHKMQSYIKNKDIDIGIDADTGTGTGTETVLFLSLTSNDFAIFQNVFSSVLDH